MTKVSDKGDMASAAPLTFGDEHFDAAEYARVAQAARLEDIRLVDCTYKSSPKFFYEAENSGKSLQQAFYGKPLGYSLDTDVGNLAGGYQWGAEVKYDRRKALSLKIGYLLVYSGLADAKPEYVELYFNKIARFTSYPFFRSHFAIQVSASGLSLPPLPSLIDRVD